MCTNLKFCAGRVVPCGKCEECLQKKRIIEYNRVRYEYDDSYVSYHVTLTYADLRSFDGFADIRDFFKSLRKEVGDCSYYAVYEEGELHGRPHFHVLLFFEKGVSLNQRLVVKHWKNGFVKCRVISKVCEVRYLTNYLFKQYGNKNIRNFSCSNHFGYKSFVKKYFPQGYYDYIVKGSCSSEFVKKFFDSDYQETLVKDLYYGSWLYLPRVWRDKYYALVNNFLNLLNKKAVTLFFLLSSSELLRKRDINVKYFDYFVDMNVASGYYQYSGGRDLEFEKNLKCAGIYYSIFVSRFGLRNMQGSILELYKWFCDSFADCFNLMISFVPEEWKSDSLRLKYISDNRLDYLTEYSYPTFKYLVFGVSGYFKLSKNELNNLVFV